MHSSEKEISFDKIRKGLEDLGKFSDQHFRIFASQLQSTSLSKADYLLKEGKICQSIYFVEKGSFRQYCVTDAGEEVTENLYIDGDWMLEYKSFTSQKPSSAFIQATEDSELLELSVHTLHELMKHADAFFQLGKVFQYALEPQQNLRQCPTPKAKYLYLLEKKPKLIQRFPLKVIASFLDITPETLSRVRKSIS